MARRRRRFKPPAPREVTIESISHEGRGIAHVEGKTVFVFGALEGERVRIQVHRRARQFDEAHTLEVLEPSPSRIEPRCEAYAVCGGCSLQHLARADQIELKQRMLLEMMAHAGLEADEVLSPLQAAAWGYRRKARLGVKHVVAKDRVLVGFRERLSPYIADMRRCEVLIPEVGHRLELISETLGRLDAKARIPQIEVAADGEHVQLVLRHLEPLSEHDREILTEFAREHGFYLQLQPGGPDSVHNLYPQTQKLAFSPLAGDSIEISFGALDFVQVNDELNRLMVSQALRLLELAPSDRVLDLFCGLGNFSLPLARRCAAVTGIEGDPAMVDRARAAAAANGIDNVEYAAADLSRPDPRDSWMRQKFDRILLDPPRSGAAEIVRNVDRLGADRVVYVSCQPSSLVRDAAIICSHGYRMTHLGVMDMFPQTAHVESMAAFARM